MSDDNLNWITVVSNAQSGNSQWTEQDVVSINAQYVRSTLDSANNSDWANVWEIEVYGVQNAGRLGCGNKKLTLNWDPNPDDIADYKVYYGRTEDTTNLASDLSLDSLGFSAHKPLVTYKSWDNLGLQRGDNVCFRLQSYYDDGESDLSNPMCGGL